MEPVIGRIHSLESCGMVDGPGLRFVAFMQGCPLRCLYCHNPDSWRLSEGRAMSSEELVEEAWKYRTWMNSSGGGNHPERRRTPLSAGVRPGHYPQGPSEKNDRRSGYIGLRKPGKDESLSGRGGPDPSGYKNRPARSPQGADGRPGRTSAGVPWTI